MSAPENPYHVMIVEARFYEDIADALFEGAKAELDAIGATYERFSVPGALEIPSAINFALRGMEFYTGRKRFDAYIGLGCVIRGETSHYDYVCNEAMRGVNDLVLQHALAFGNGILTVENQQQAIVRADINQKNKGGDAAKAALTMLEMKHHFGMYPR